VADVRTAGSASAGATPPVDVWVCSEVYHPEETSTGLILTRIAEALAGEPGLRVGVLCAQPGYASRGVRAPAEEVRNGVAVKRCAGTTFDRARLPLRVVNQLTVTLSMGWAALRRVGPGSRVVVCTNPPTLPAVMALVARLRGASLILLVHDLYPEILETLGLIGPGGPASRLLGRARGLVLRRADAVVAIGRDMRERLLRAEPSLRGRVVVIPNWADDDEIRPHPEGGRAVRRELGLGDDHLVVQIAGNVGRTHDLATVLDAARALEADAPGGAGGRVRFMIVSSDAKAVRSSGEARGLGSVTFVGRQPRERLNDVLNACDVALIPFVAGMAGLSVPSRMYNLLSAGRPIVALADPSSELALVVGEEEAGWVVPPGDAAALAALLRRLAAEPDEVARRGANALTAARAGYGRERILARWKRLVLAGPSREDEPAAATAPRAPVALGRERV
jgi:colanic acid biosynthesis glycosyl transferase WcaI